MLLFYLLSALMRINVFVTDDVLPVGVQLTAGDQTATDQRWTVATVWIAGSGGSAGRLDVEMGQRQARVVDHLAAGRLVDQSGRAAQVDPRRAERHVGPETFCSTSTRGWLVGWLGFNGTFSTNRPYRAIGKVKVCLKKVYL